MTDKPPPQKIHSIVGYESNVNPLARIRYVVGGKETGGTVTAITFNVENRGDHGIGWFDVWKDENTKFATINERAVAEVIYKQRDSNGHV